MRKNLSSHSAFSLLEILLAAIIFIITIGSCFVALHAVRVPVANKESALSAAVFGKQILEALRTQVNAATFYGSSCQAVNNDGSCGDFSLFLGSHEISTTTLSAQGLNWPSTAIMQANVAGGNTAVVYNVLCADNTTTSCNSSGNTDMARLVNLGINWPNAV